ncbi:MAG: hypothetical protein WBQ24_20795, partial [Xanthobacteraceae bacterium]
MDVSFSGVEKTERSVFMQEACQANAEQKSQENQCRLRFWWPGPARLPLILSSIGATLVAGQTVRYFS